MGSEELEKVVSVDSDGEITILKQLRERSSVGSAERVSFVQTDDGTLAIRPADESVSDDATERTAAVSPDGETVIPEAFRDAAGIETPGRIVIETQTDDELVIRPVEESLGY